MPIDYESADIGGTDSLYEPRKSGDATAPVTGYSVAGADLNSKYAPVSMGTALPGVFGYAVAGVDFHQIFAAKNSVPRYPTPLPWVRTIDVEATIYRQPSRAGYLQTALRLSMSIHREGRVLASRTLPQYDANPGLYQTSAVFNNDQLWADAGASPNSPYQSIFQQVAGSAVSSMSFGQPLGQWLEFVQNGIDHQTIFTSIGYDHTETEGVKTGSATLAVGVRRKEYPASNIASGNLIVNYKLNVEPSLFQNIGWGGTHTAANLSPDNYQNPAGNRVFKAGLMFRLQGSTWAIYSAAWRNNQEIPWQMIAQGVWLRNSQFPATDFEALFTQVGGAFNGEDSNYPMPNGWVPMSSGAVGFVSILGINEATVQGDYSKHVSVNVRIRQISTKNWPNMPDNFVEAVIRFVPTVQVQRPDYTITPGTDYDDWATTVTNVTQTSFGPPPDLINSPMSLPYALSSNRSIPRGVAAPTQVGFGTSINFTSTAEGIIRVIIAYNMSIDGTPNETIVSTNDYRIVSGSPQDYEFMLENVSGQQLADSEWSNWVDFGNVGNTTFNLIRFGVTAWVSSDTSSYTHTGNVRFRVRHKTYPSHSATLDISLNAGATLTAYTGGGSSGGGGGDVGGGGNCIVATGKLLRDDFTEVMAKDVRVGDKLLSLVIPGMVDESVVGWDNWTTTSLGDTDYTVVTVKRAHHSTFGRHYLINDTLPITKQHPIFTRRQGVWMWLDANELVNGDYLLSSEVEPVEITSIEVISGEVHVVDFNVEEVDVYFAGGYLVHNANEQPKEPDNGNF